MKIHHHYEENNKNLSLIIGSLAHHFNERKDDAGEPMKSPCKG